MFLKDILCLLLSRVRHKTLDVGYQGIIASKAQILNKPWMGLWPNLEAIETECAVGTVAWGTGRAAGTVARVTGRAAGAVAIGVAAAWAKI